MLDQDLEVFVAVQLMYILIIIFRESRQLAQNIEDFNQRFCKKEASANSKIERVFTVLLIHVEEVILFKEVKPTCFHKLLREFLVII